MINKKGALANDKLMILILVILVVVSVLIFFYKADILRHFRNLPEFGSSEVEEVNVGGGTGTTTSTNCPIQIGSIGPGSEATNQIWSCLTFDGTCGVAPMPSYLVWGAKEMDGEIRISQTIFEVNWLNWINKDAKIGVIQNNNITIDKEILEEGERYIKLKADLPSPDFLSNLNGAYKNSGNLICRDTIL